MKLDLACVVQKLGGELHGDGSVAISGLAPLAWSKGKYATGGGGFTSASLTAMEAMSRAALSMLRESLDAFVDRDVDRAEAVAALAAEVDALYGKLLRSVFAWMREHPDAIPAGQAVVSVAKYLERVADHATNLAELVVFMVRGVDVRHRDNDRGAP